MHTRRFLRSPCEEIRDSVISATSEGETCVCKLRLKNNSHLRFMSQSPFRSSWKCFAKQVMKSQRFDFVQNKALVF